MEFPANSNKQKVGPSEKQEPKRVERVVTGQVRRQKRPLSKRFYDVFIGGDAPSVWSYVAYDVLIPAAKDTISDAISQGVERMLFGETSRSSSRRRSQSNNGYVSYNRFAPSSNRRDREEPRHISRRGRVSHDFDEIILATRAEADEVIERLFDLVSRYESATVSDLYELVGVTGEFTDEKYGWTDLRGSGVTRVRNGYLLDLPKPELLD